MLGERAGWEDAAGEACCVAGVIGARCAGLAALFGGENWERFEIGMWFGCRLEGEFLKTRGGGW